MRQDLASLGIDMHRHLLEDVLASPVHLNPDWLTGHKWAAVPVGEQITQVDAEWIADAAAFLKIERAISISTNPDGYGDSFEVPMTQTGLLQFDDRIQPRHFLLVPRNREFAILHEGDYYFIVAGPYDFVRRAVGCSLKTARTMFRERFAKDFYSERTKRFLLAVSERYEPFNGEISPTNTRPAGLVERREGHRREGSVTVLPAEDRWRDLPSDLLQTKVELNLECLREHQWTAVPLSAPINEMTAEWLADATAAIGVLRCLALPTEPAISAPCLEVPMTQSAL